ncbi:MAG: TatD family hydrolase [Alphaproteobacteria bacterium]|nr:TatD family hydrolase [Alphaproteobacteria bacterium]
MAEPFLVDSHCHLDFPDFADDLAAVRDRAAAAGVGRLLTICTHLSRFAPILALAEAHDDIYCTVGVHPHEADEEGIADPAPLIAHARHPKVVGIGETGLDYYYEHSPRAAQRESFRAHIAAARETGLPLIVHTRDADADTVAILRDESAAGAFAGVLHCFSTDRAVAEAALDLGLYISFSGILTFKKADDLRAIARDVPLDRLLVETDAPFLAPVPFRGKRNEPAFVARTAACLAEIRGMDEAAVARTTTENFFRLFEKAGRPA